MANKKISDLEAASVINANDLLAMEQNGVAKKLSGTVFVNFLQAHGGITSTSYTPPVAPSLEGTLTLNFVDGTSASVSIMNGAKGDAGSDGISPTATVERVGHRATITITDANGTTSAYVDDGNDGQDGADGNPGYCHIKWAAIEPTSDSDLSDIPDAWMGIYSGDSSTAPTAYTAYAWYKIKGETGADGAKGNTGNRGTYIYRSTSDAYSNGSVLYINDSALVSPEYASYPHDVQQGDVIFYGDKYYFATGDYEYETTVGRWRVDGPTYINSAALPDGGSTSQVLMKSSNNDYEVEWADAPVTYVEYDDASAGNSVFSLEARVVKDYRVYFPMGTFTGPFSFNKYQYFTATGEDGTVYWVKATFNTSTLAIDWTNGSISPGGGTPYDSTPSALGTASAGSSTEYSRGDHVHAMPTAAQVGAIAAPSSPATGAFLVWDGTAWTAQTLSTWQGGSY